MESNDVHHAQGGSYFIYLLYKVIGDDDDENNDDDGGIVEVDWLELHRIERRCGRWGMYGDTRTLEVLVVSCNTLQCNPIPNHNCATNVLLYHNKLNTTTTRSLQLPSHQLPCDPRASRPTFSGMYWWTDGQKTWTWTVTRVQLRPAAQRLFSEKIMPHHATTELLQMRERTD